MSNELMTNPPGSDSTWSWQVAKATKQIRDRARVKAVEVDAAAAVGGYIMHTMSQLDKDRERLGGNNANRQLLLIEIQDQVRQQALMIQRDLFREWRY
jgi:hypothetical protein